MKCISRITRPNGAAFKGSRHGGTICPSHMHEARHRKCVFCQKESYNVIYLGDGGYSCYWCVRKIRIQERKRELIG